MSSSDEITVIITKSAQTLRSINVGQEAVKKFGGGNRVRVHVTNRPEEFREGTLSPGGILTGMGTFYGMLGLKAGKKVTFRMGEEGIEITSPKARGRQKAQKAKTSASVFQTKKLNPIHFERFRPENLVYWKPQAENDVLVAFGVLQEFTDYRYCCHTTQEVLNQLGYSGGAKKKGTKKGTKKGKKPDAILIEEETSGYLIAEFKIRSSQFVDDPLKPEDVDVLVCWEDDEKNRSKLPTEVVSLLDIAREAALDQLNEKPTEKP